MRKSFLLTIMLFSVAFAQTTLVPGDVAIVGYNSDTPSKQFAFVITRAGGISAGTEINFTDNGWKADNTFRAGEGIVTYTATSSLSQGTVIAIDVTTNGSPALLLGSGSVAMPVTATSTPSFSTSGDQILVYQGTLGAPAMVYAFNNEGSAVWQAEATTIVTSALPLGLTNGVSAFAINEVDNCKYTGTTTFSSRAELLSAIANPMNWSSDDVSNYTLTDFNEFALPVELTSFTSTSIGNAITLNWATATEVDNYGFEVERSADNTTFTKVGFVAGAGNSNVQKQYSFVDENLANGTYYYRLKQVDTDGSFEYSQVVSSSVSETPATFSLDQNYPNPFNPSTKISFALAKDSDVKLSVFNTLGEEVAVLINSTLTAGNHSVDFNATNLTSGMYLYKIQAGSFVATRKMSLVK